MNDVEMQDAMNDSPSSMKSKHKHAIAINSKLESLTGNLLSVKGTFEFDPIGTNELRALRSSQLENVTLSQNVGSSLRQLYCYSLPMTNNQEFLELTCEPSKLYV